MTFSCQRRLAQFLMSPMGENLRTGTYKSLTLLRIVCEAILVFLKLKGAPSMNTITAVRAVLRPSGSSDWTVIKAKDKSLEPGEYSRALMIFLVFFMSSEKCWASLILQVFTMSTFPLLLLVHLETPVQVLGPV